MKKTFLLILCLTIANVFATAKPARSLHELQQDFVNLKFGLFIHFGLGTYHGEDWADPEASPLDFNPTKLDCNQWADAAKSANMNFGCISVKHHCGFCLWDTKTTDFSVMNSGIRRDVLKEFTDAMHARGMKVIFHFSILDMHEKILPKHIKAADTQFIKDQLHELLTNYGPVTALMIDGWDAPWSRISYDDISFEEIYNYAKSIQPECLVMDLNGAKYPADGLFYSDLKTYEQGAGQKIQNKAAALPSMACDHLQPTWFWKEYFPGMELTSAESMVNDNIIPKTQAGCTFIMNVAPNRDGLFDRNAVERLAEIGKLWKDDGSIVKVEKTHEPLISTNLAKNKHAIGSWSYDSFLHDFVTDDNFGSPWISSMTVKEPWVMVDLGEETDLNAVAITCTADCSLDNYSLDVRTPAGEWKEVFNGDAPTWRRVKIHRFGTLKGNAVRLRINKATAKDYIKVAELGVYNESR
ncbi:MAG: alpha-L-fucosidase [Muribaculaceae bacterium]|nr:alpha-L-fucosidase [Muribaculaceae bacterium]